MSSNTQEDISQKQQRMDRLRRKLKTAIDLYERSGTCWAKAAQASAIKKLNEQISALEDSCQHRAAQTADAGSERIELETNKTRWPLPG